MRLQKPPKLRRVLLLIPVNVFWILLTAVRWYTLDGISPPLDSSFSCWFFYVLARVFWITGNLYGWDAGAFGIPTFCSPVPQIPSPLKTGSNAR